MASSCAKGRPCSRAVATASYAVVLAAAQPQHAHERHAAHVETRKDARKRAHRVGVAREARHGALFVGEGVLHEAAARAQLQLHVARAPLQKATALDQVVADEQQLAARELRDDARSMQEPPAETRPASTLPLYSATECPRSDSAPRPRPPGRRRSMVAREASA